MFGLLPGCRIEWLRVDVLAGLTTAAVVIPQCMAYAGIADLPVQTGLYVALVPMLAYAFLGTSRNLSVSSTTTLAILTGAELAVAVPDGDPTRMAVAASALTLLTGAILLMAGALRLGFLANFISDPVLTGFKAGIGLVMIAGQVPKLLGITIAKGGFFHSGYSIVRHLPDTHFPTLMIAVGTLTLLFGVQRFMPRLPAPLLAVAVGIAAAGLTGLQRAGVLLTGYIPAGIPGAAIPDLSLLQSLWPAALGMALMCFAESIAAARAFVRHDDPQPQANRELIALGVANVAGSLFLCFPAGGGTSQTAVNSAAGARSQLAEIVTAAVVLAALLFLSPLISLLPQATLAAIVVVSCIPLLNPTDFRAILRIRRAEFLWALIACVGVVLFGTLQGILVAVAVSVLMIFYQATHPPVYVLGRDPATGEFRPITAEHSTLATLPGLLILRTEGDMNFASAPRVGERMGALLRELKPRVVILECSAVTDLEYTAMRELTTAARQMRAAGISLWLAGLNPAVQRVVKRSPLVAALGSERIYADLHQAVSAYEQ